ncbi:MAG: mechanosensitive ion channel domain-containing protein [Candidatus Aenigmatarchaeota archaeon]
MNWFTELYSFAVENNSLTDFLWALGFFVSVAVILAGLKHWFQSKLEARVDSTDAKWDDMLLEFLKSFRWSAFIIVGFFIGLIYLDLPEVVETRIRTIMLVIFTYFGFKLAGLVVDVITSLIITPKGDEPVANLAAKRNASRIAKILMFLFALMFLLDNFGFDITTWLTGLGIGGVAIALAFKNILSDLISFFSILGGKEIEIGDYIKIDSDIAGNVERMGFKHIILRALSGERIVVPNKILTENAFRNFSRKTEPFEAFEICISIDMKGKDRRKAKEIIRQAIDSTSNVEFKRCYFKKIGAYGYIYEVAYQLKTTSFDDLVEARDIINENIITGFDAEGIVMSFPAQTVNIYRS